MALLSLSTGEIRPSQMQSAERLVHCELVVGTVSPFPSHDCSTIERGRFKILLLYMYLYSNIYCDLVYALCCSVVPRGWRVSRESKPSIILSLQHLT